LVLDTMLIKLSETVDREMVVFKCHVSFHTGCLSDTNKRLSPVGSSEVVQSN